MNQSSGTSKQPQQSKKPRPSLVEYFGSQSPYTADELMEKLELTPLGYYLARRIAQICEEYLEPQAAKAQPAGSVFV